MRSGTDPFSASLISVLAHAVAESPLRGSLNDGTPCSCLTFRDYMKLCLYDPCYGYYRSGEERVGRSGDFYTSAYIGALMGETLADHLERLALAEFGADAGSACIDVLDWGGGTGRLAAQMLERWQARGAVTAARFRLTVIDDHPGHRRQAEAVLAEAIRDDRAAVLSVQEARAICWRDRRVILVGNELLDAFPVHRVVCREDVLKEWGVTWDASTAKPIPCLMPLTTPLLSAWMERDDMKLMEGQSTEVCLDAGVWLSQRYADLGEALIVLLDYGDESAELTAPHRLEGTLLCYYRHTAHADPYLRPGEQDMTAHVNFTALRHAAIEAGWTELWYGTQKRFLVEGGILAKLTAHHITDPFHPEVKRNRAIRQLLLSDGMSELFKVQIFKKS